MKNRKTITLNDFNFKVRKRGKRISVLHPRSQYFFDEQIIFFDVDDSINTQIKCLNIIIEFLIKNLDDKFLMKYAKYSHIKIKLTKVI